MFPRRKILPPLHDGAARPMSHRVCRLLHFLNIMRNILLMLSLVAAAAWAADPLLGPGNVGEKDAKGHVKGAEGGKTNRTFKPQLERRADRPAEAVDKERRDKGQDARRQDKDA